MAAAVSVNSDEFHFSSLLQSSALSNPPLPFVSKAFSLARPISRRRQLIRNFNSRAELFGRVVRLASRMRTLNTDGRNAVTHIIVGS
jgi:hypothetical protein